ncbi:unnamed protein product [Euphydryas editha]|uniref:Uncharacterized protein n=1 Tax=Euphydryas editha TaxID=104508 RepID=A0AAU9V598_EUPED|nr:unnamed protein product [Euphydryas editha]
MLKNQSKDTDQCIVNLKRHWARHAVKNIWSLWCQNAGMATLQWKALMSQIYPSGGCDEPQRAGFCWKKIKSVRNP